MNTYHENITKYDARLRELSKLLSRVAWLRLIIFVASGGIIIYLFSHNLIAPVFVVLPILIFVFGKAVNYHNKVAFRKRHTTFLKNINESELLRAECKLDSFESGDQFISHTHPYTADLDIFGQHSIFQLLSRTTTESGGMLLAEWLSEPASNAEIRERQKAVKELVPKLDWRQDFQASGMHFQNKKSAYTKLLDWVQAPTVLLKHRIAYLVMAITLSVLTLLAFSLSIIYWRYIYLYSFLAISTINYFVLKRVKTIADDIVKSSQENIDTVNGYRALIDKIERESFESEKLRELQSKLSKGENSAFYEIDKLCKLLEFSQRRGVRIKFIQDGGNPVYAFLNNFLLLDIFLILGVEKWKSKNKSFLKPWAEVISEFEVLSSLAAFSYSNPDYAFAELDETTNHIRFEALGHPLIHAAKRVSNDFSTDGQTNVVMVTGSNMGGKSTFLRTVGVNIVLALTGAPCCAKFGKLANLQLFSSMRTQDNLLSGVSSFYAELNRIEQLLKQIESSPNVFFLLDEMFKGTNSQDRHKGGFSLINQVSKLQTSGIIATHDIDLAKLAGRKDLVVNYSFNSEIKDDAMLFSYKLEPVICRDFNASELMRRSGIQIIEDLSKIEAE